MTEVVDAEVMPRADAERLDSRIRSLVRSINDSLDELHQLVDEAKTTRTWEALGFPSWTAYLVDVFPSNLKLDRPQRRELVSYLSGEGMSNRAIGAVIGADERTVRRDAAAANAAPEPAPVIGLDGKTYQRRDSSSGMTPEEAAELTESIREGIRGFASHMTETRQAWAAVGRSLILSREQLGNHAWLDTLPKAGVCEVSAALYMEFSRCPTPALEEAILDRLFDEILVGRGTHTVPGLKALVLDSIRGYAESLEAGE